VSASVCVRAFFPGSARKLSSVSKTHASRKKTYYTPFAGLESNHLKIKKGKEKD
jgi:hypothetical protein